MNAHPLRKRLTVFVTAFATVSGGIPYSVMAAPANPPQAVPSSAPPNGVSAADIARVRTGLNGLPFDIDRIKAELVSVTKAPGSRPIDALLAARAAQALNLLDIVTTKNAAERHNKIRQLPVKITQSAATDGRTGTIKRFIVDGTPQIEIFVPATPLERSVTGAFESERPTGPAAAKDDDCYDGPAPCSSQQDMDDLGAAIAMAQAQVDQGWSDYYSACNADPSDCMNESETASGPSADPRCGPCASEAGQALAALAGGAGSLALTYVGYESAVASGLTLTTAGAAVMLTGVGLVGFGVGYYVGYWAACAWYAVAPSLAQGPMGLDPFEPVPMF